MTTEERWEFLRLASKRVLDAFKAGRNPTFEQINKLEAAIECIDGLKICGHRLIEECDCAELDPAAFVVLERTAKQEGA